MAATVQNKIAGVQPTDKPTDQETSYRERLGRTKLRNKKKEYLERETQNGFLSKERPRGVKRRSRNALKGGRREKPRESEPARRGKKAKEGNRSFQNVPTSDDDNRDQGGTTETKDEPAREGANNISPK